MPTARRWSARSVCSSDKCVCSARLEMSNCIRAIDRARTHVLLEVLDLSSASISRKRLLVTAASEEQNKRKEAARATDGRLRLEAVCLSALSSPKLICKRCHPIGSAEHNSTSRWALRSRSHGHLMRRKHSCLRSSRHAEKQRTVPKEGYRLCSFHFEIMSINLQINNAANPRHVVRALPS